MNSKILAVAVLAVAVIAVLALVPADESEASVETYPAPDIIAGTVDSPIVIGDGESLSMGGDLTFTGDGVINVAAGGMLSIDGSLSVTASGDIIVFQPNSYMSILGSPTVITRETVVSLHGEFSIEYAEGARSLIELDLGTGSVLDFGGMESTGIEGPEVRVTTDVTETGTSIGIMIETADQTSVVDGATYVFDGVSVDVLAGFGQDPSDVIVTDNAGAGPGTVDIGEITIRDASGTVSVRDLHADVGVASNGAITVDATLGALEFSDATTGARVLLEDLSVFGGFLLAAPGTSQGIIATGLEITGPDGTGAMAVDIGHISYSGSVSDAGDVLSYRISAVDVTATVSGGDISGSIAATAVMESAYGEVSIASDGAEWDPLGIALTGVTIDAEYGDGFAVDVSVKSALAGGDARALIGYLWSIDNLVLGDMTAYMDVETSGLSFRYEDSGDGTTDATVSLDSISGSLFVMSKDLGIGNFEFLAENASYDTNGGQWEVSADLFRYTAYDTYVEEFSEEVTGLCIAADRISYDMYRLDSVAYGGETGHLTGEDVVIDYVNGHSGTFTADFDGLSYLALTGPELVGSPLFCFSHVGYGPIFTVYEGVTLNLADGTMFAGIEYEGGTINGTARVCKSYVVHLEDATGELYFSGFSPYDVVVTYEDSRIVSATIGLCNDPNNGYGYIGFRDHEFGIPYTVSEDLTSVVLDLSGGLGDVIVNMISQQFTVTVEDGEPESYEMNDYIIVETDEVREGYVFAGYDDGYRYAPAGERYFITYDARLTEIWIPAGTGYSVEDGWFVFRETGGTVYIPDMSSVIEQMEREGAEGILMEFDVGTVSIATDMLPQTGFLATELSLRDAVPPSVDRSWVDEAYIFGLYYMDTSFDYVYATITLNAEGIPAEINGSTVVVSPCTISDGKTAMDVVWRGYSNPDYYVLLDAPQVPDIPATSGGGDSVDGSGGMDTMIIAAFVIVVIVVAVAAVVVMRRRNAP